MSVKQQHQPTASTVFETVCVAFRIKKFKRYCWFSNHGSFISKCLDSLLGCQFRIMTNAMSPQFCGFEKPARVALRSKAVRTLSNPIFKSWNSIFKWSVFNAPCPPLSSLPVAQAFFGKCPAARCFVVRGKLCAKILEQLKCNGIKQCLRKPPSSRSLRERHVRPVFCFSRSLKSRTLRHSKIN